MNDSQDFESSQLDTVDDNIWGTDDGQFPRAFDATASSELWIGRQVIDCARQLFKNVISDKQ